MVRIGIALIESGRAGIEQGGGWQVLHLARGDGGLGELTLIGGFTDRGSGALRNGGRRDATICDFAGLSLTLCCGVTDRFALRLGGGGSRDRVVRSEGFVGGVDWFGCGVGFAFIQIHLLGFEGRAFGEFGEEFRFKGLGCIRLISFRLVGLGGSDFNERTLGRIIGNRFGGLHFGNFGWSFHRGVGHCSGLAALGGREGLVRFELGILGIGSLRSVSKFAFVEDRLIGFREHGFREFAQERGRLDRLGVVLFDRVRVCGLDLHLHRFLLKLRIDVHRLGLFLGLELRNLKISGGLLGREGEIRLGHFGFLGNALEGQFLLGEGIQADLDFGGGKLRLFLEFLGNHQGCHADQHEQVDNRGSSEALVEEAGNVLPAFEQVDQSDEGDDGEDEPPSDVTKEFLELLPAGEVGVADDFARGGTVEAVVGVILRGVCFVIGAEEEVKSIHADGGIGDVALLDVKVHLFGFEGDSIDDPAEIDGIALPAGAVPIGGEKDVVATGGECGLHVMSARVEVRNSLRFQKAGNWSELVLCLAGACDGVRHKNVLSLRPLSIGGEEELLVVGGKSGPGFVVRSVDLVAERNNALPLRSVPPREVEVESAFAALAIRTEVEELSVAGEGGAAFVGGGIDGLDRFGSAPEAAVPMGDEQVAIGLMLFPTHQNHLSAIRREGGFETSGEVLGGRLRLFLTRILLGGCFVKVVGLRILPEDEARLVFLHLGPQALVVCVVGPEVAAHLPEERDSDEAGHGEQSDGNDPSLETREAAAADGVEELPEGERATLARALCHRPHRGRGFRGDWCDLGFSGCGRRHDGC